MYLDSEHCYCDNFKLHIHDLLFQSLSAVLRG